MRLIFAEHRRRFCRHHRYLRFHVVLLFAVGSIGCNNICFTFTSNPPTGTIGIKAGDPPPACTLAKATGPVRLVMQTIPMCGACPESSRIRHFVVSIQGIEVHGSSAPSDESPDWQELAPQLATQPQQVDLVGGTGAREPFGEIVAIPAGIYRQVRVRFARELLVEDDRLAAKNACAGAGFNCVVMADGSVQPLLFASAYPELRIPSESIVGGAALVFPDVESDLVIEMKPIWSRVSPVNRDMRLLPTLTGNAKVERVEFDQLGISVAGAAYSFPSR